MGNRQDALTQKELKKWLKYCPETGKFTWTDAKRFVSKREAGSRKKYGYVSLCLNGIQYYAHRLAWLYVHGRFPKDQIDHINGVRWDNRISNLREADVTVNGRNCKMNSRNTSGYRGVDRHPSRNKWRGRIRVDGKSISLGEFDTKEEAFKARLAAEKKYGFHPNHGRRELPRGEGDE